MLHVVPAGILSFPSGYTIANAILLDGSPDELTFTPFPAGTGAGKKYTLSFWTKIVDTESTGTFFSAGNSGGDSLRIQTDWSSGNPFLNFNDSSGGSSNWLRRTGTRVLRDPTAWTHICFAVDNSSGGGLGGTANAARVYINGAEDTSFGSASTHPASSETSRMTMQYEHVIGTGAGFDDYKSFYLAEFIIVDGQQLAPTAFGKYDNNGVWLPIDPTKAITNFGTNGAHLKFDSAALVGKSSTSTTTPTVSWLGSQAFTSGASSNTIFTDSSASFGDAASNRSIVIAVGGARQTGGERNVSSVVVNSGSGDVSATRVIGRHGNDNAQEFWTVPLASGTTGTIVATFSGSMVPASITWWRVLDLGQPISTDTGQDVDGYTTLNATTIGQTGDVTFYALQDSGSSTGYSWSNATERAEHLNITSASSPATLYSATAAEFVFTSDENHIETLNITGGSGNESSFAAVTFSNNNSFTATSMGANNVVIDTCTDDSSADVTFLPCLDPNNKESSLVLSSTNLKAENDSASSWQSVLGNIGLTSGRFYYEITRAYTGHGYDTSGVAGDGKVAGDFDRGSAGAITFDTASGKIRKYVESTSAADYYTSGTGSATGDVIGVDLDVDNDTIELIVGGTGRGTLDISGLAKPFFPISMIYTGGNVDHVYNFGASSYTHSKPGAASNITKTATGVTNVATWNPLTLSGGALSHGNTKFAASGASQGCLATIGASSGKYFCEARMERLNNGTVFFGVKPTSASLMTTASASSPWNQAQNLYFAYFSLDNLGGNMIDPETASAISDNSSKYTVADGSTIGCVLDLDDYDVRWYKLVDAAWVQITNSTAAATTVDLYPTGLQWTFAATGSQSGDNVVANFGQRPFSATPPDGAVAMSTVNLPKPTVTNPSDYFNTVLYEGTGSTNARTDVGFQPDWVWIKNRTGTAASHNLYDVIRGANKSLKTNTSDAELTSRTDLLTSFDSSGFTLGADADQQFCNKDDDTYVAFCWKAGGSPSNNGNGSTTSSVSAASYGGFSVGTYTGATGAQTIGHGLSRKPSWIIVKNRDDGGQTWTVYQEDIANDGSGFIILNLSNASTSGAACNSTAPTGPTDGTGVFSVGNGAAASNTNSEKYVFYAFAKTPGLIGSGTYAGNNSASGPFIQIDDDGSGFKPAWLLIKRINGTENWFMFNNKSDAVNPAGHYLMPDATTVENDHSGGNDVDFTANGFKLRSTNAGTNAASNYIYLAFAEDPFGGDSITQARAR